MATITYGYADDRGVRYVGKTSYALSYRHNHHAHEARKGTVRYFYNWWRKQDERPRPIMLGVHPTDQDALDTERELIALCRAMGEPLTNATDGGETGPSGMRHTEETKAKMSAAQRARTKEPHAGHRHSPEARARIGAAGKGRPAWNKGKKMWSDEDRARIGEQVRARGPQTAAHVEARIRHVRGERNVNAKITAQAALEIRRRAAAGEKGTTLARDFGIAPSTAYRVIRGELWRAD